MKVVRIVLQILLPLAILGIGWYVAVMLVEAREEPETEPIEIPLPLVQALEVKPTGQRLTVRAEGNGGPSYADGAGAGDFGACCLGVAFARFGRFLREGRGTVEGGSARV